MKITIENTWPATSKTIERHHVYTADDNAWDTSLADALNLIAGLLKQFGYADKAVDDAIYPDGEVD